MVDIKYVSSRGTEINLMSDTIRIMEANFHNYEWDADVTEYLIGERVDRFRQSAISYDATLFFMGDTISRRSLIDSVHSEFEYDIAKKSPGKLYWGDYYLECYIVASSTYAGELSDTVNEIKIYAPRPRWILPTTVSCPIDQSIASTFLDFDYDFPYDYTGEDLASATITNASSLSGAFIWTITSPVMSPHITIAGHRYEVYGTLVAGDTLVVNTLDKTIVKTDSNNASANWFNNRNKTVSIFEPIPYGTSTITWSGLFSFTIELFQERSEPAWTSN